MQGCGHMKSKIILQNLKGFSLHTSVKCKTDMLIKMTVKDLEYICH